MSVLSPILREAVPGVLQFHCPGCDEDHLVWTGEGHRARWGYNGNPDRPTFTPSILIRSGHYAPGQGEGSCYCTWDDKDDFPELKCSVCHSFITDGRIQFLDDCTHALAGQTVELPAFPE